MCLWVDERPTWAEAYRIPSHSFTIDFLAMSTLTVGHFGAPLAVAIRRIGVLMPYDENDSIAKPRVSAFAQALALDSVAPMAATCGWTFGGPAMTSGYWTGT